MEIYNKLLEHVEIPRFVKIHQDLLQSSIDDPYTETKKVIEESRTFSVIQPGNSVCIACGSREIENLRIIVKGVVEKAKAAGGQPFLIPAMGSHGGATAKGQQEILETYGLTEDVVGAPIRSCMDTVRLGTTPSGLEVRIDKYAAESDVIILVARIKPHTDFGGRWRAG